LAIRYHGITVITREGGQTFECRANEMEQHGANACMVSGLRSAPVRVIIRDDATNPEINETLRVASRILDARQDPLPATDTPPGKGGGHVYTP
jgi:hypothetical protein